MKRLSICVLLFFLLFPFAGYGGKKDKKKNVDRKLVLVDETEFRKKVDSLLKSDTYKDLLGPEKTNMRGFVEAVAKKYAEELDFGRSVQEIQASLDSIPKLLHEKGIAEAANEGLRQECESLERQKTDMANSLDSLKAQLAEKDKIVDSLRAEVEKAHTQGSRAVEMFSKLTETLEADMQKARASSLRDLDPSFYEKLKSSYGNVSHVLSLLDSQRDEELKKDVEKLAGLEAFRAVVAEADALFNGQYNKDIRTGLLERLKLLTDKKDVLSADQQVEMNTYLLGLNNEGRYAYRLKQLMIELKAQGAIGFEDQLEEWQKKLDSFKASHESLPEWPLMGSLKKAVEGLSTFLKLDAKGKVPVSLADTDLFKAGIQEIWSIVENSEL